jgi:hypothetical protein
MNTLQSNSHWVAGIVIIAIVFLLLHRMDRLVAVRGSIFRRTRPGEVYLFPLLLGLLVLGFAVVGWLAGMQLYLFVVAGFALLLYGLGYSDLLDQLQGRDSIETDGQVDL